MLSNASEASAFDWSAFRIIAHRGASAVAPENTLVALSRAADAGARSVELDVMLSADGVPIIIHDTNLKRTTNGTGPVASHSFDAISQLDAGSWFGADFAGERVPTLSDAVDLIVGRKMVLNLEIKPSPGEDKETAARAINVLSETWADPATLVLSSASIESLEVVRDAAPQWQRGLIAKLPPANWRGP
jgi:glycerophosphoryl diester phosphodiesterase